MKKYLFLFIIVSFLAGCGSGGGGSASTVDDNNSGNNTGITGGNKVNSQCSRTGKIAKLKVSKDGIYKFAYSDLYSDCPAVSIASDTISLSSQGADIPIEVIDSNSNGFFEAGDSIEFYGKAIGRDDSRFRFTETNVYWLSVGEGEKEGKRIKKVTPPANVGPPLMPAFSFPRMLHMEKDALYVQKNYPDISSPSDLREHWFWGKEIYPKDLVDPNDDTYPYPFMRDYFFSTRHIDRDVSKVFLKLRLQSVSREHYINVYINDKPIPDNTIMWNSQAPYDLQLTVDSSFFVDSGLNKLTIESVAGGLFYLDWFDVTYNREYIAEHNVIEFTGKDFIKLSGFTSNQVSVYEISDPENVLKINISVPSNYVVSFLSPFNDVGLFVALTSDQKMSPVIEPYTPSDITSNPGDYIIITHEDFADAIKTLADYRAQQGYNVITVKVRDIYDEFGGGVETPHAIKAFLKYAYENWSPKPVHILLVGDATVDYKDLSGNGEKSGIKSYVPAYLYNYPGLGEVPSDNWFVDVNDDVLPDMNIGRVPAKFPDDVSSVVSKIMSHERSDKSTNVLLIADDDNPKFEDLSNAVSDRITLHGYNALKVYQSGLLQDGFKPAILSGIDSNPLIVNYTGHGAVYDWANNMFSSGDIDSLSNSNYPFVVALNCFNGYFSSGDEKPFPSISEAFLLARNKGAVAVFAASSWGYLSDHDPLARELYNTLLKEDVTLGEAVRKAKTAAYINKEIMQDAVQTFIFFGDPATRLK